MIFLVSLSYCYRVQCDRGLKCLKSNEVAQSECWVTSFSLCTNLQKPWTKTDRKRLPTSFPDYFSSAWLDLLKLGISQEQIKEITLLSSGMINFEGRRSINVVKSKGILKALLAATIRQLTTDHTHHSCLRSRYWFYEGRKWTGEPGEKPITILVTDMLHHLTAAQ